MYLMEKIKEAVNKARSERYMTSVDEEQGAIVKNSDSFQIGISQKTNFDNHRSNDSLVYPIQYEESITHHVDAEILKEKRIITKNDKTPAGKAYNLLRTKVLQKLEENGWNSFAVVSANGGEGKTLTAINLAISIARDIKHTALLADFDLINPGVHRHFDYFPEYAFEDYLLSDIGLNKILMNPGIEGLLVLPGKGEVNNSAETLASPSVQHLANELKNYYQSRVIIYDLPPLLETDDALCFSSCYDAVLIVIEDGKTTEDDLVRMSEVLGNKPVLGTILNKSPL